MKRLKKICLAAAVAMALAAAVVPSASADARVCSTSAGTHSPTTSCGAGHGWIYSGVFHSTLRPSTSFTLRETSASGGTVGTVTCTEATASGTVDGTTGTGSVTAYTFVTSSCSDASCPSGVHVSTAGAPWASTFTFSSGTAGQLHISGVEVDFACTAAFGITITCKFSAATSTLEVTGGEPALLKAQNISMTKTSGPESTCGAKADSSGEYQVATPSSVFITPTFF